MLPLVVVCNTGDLHGIVAPVMKSTGVSSRSSIGAKCLGKLQLQMHRAQLHLNPTLLSHDACLQMSGAATATARRLVITSTSSAAALIAGYVALGGGVQHW